MRVNKDKLKELRLSRGLSRFKLALELDISPSTIEKIETEQRTGLCTIYKLAKYFNVKMEDLL